jgi:hypothetical protein
MKIESKLYAIHVRQVPPPTHRDPINFNWDPYRGGECKLKLVEIEVFGFYGT